MCLVECVSLVYYTFVLHCVQTGFAYQKQLISTSDLGLHCFMKRYALTCFKKVSKTKITEIANRLNPDEVAQYDPSRLDIHCLPASL